MTNRIKQFRTVAWRSFLVFALAFVFVPTLAAAQADLDYLRATGAIAERFDGYVMVREESAEATALVARVNAERKAIYQQRAVEQGVGVEEVGKVYAAQIIKKAPVGTWFLNEDGSWIRR
jgi:uncharacterized protein YdbL (DUF1318 family)